MQRPITGFGVDEAGDPFATLSCGHRQHVRHDPPFTNRPWVVTEQGRDSALGALLDCLRCDRFEIPETFRLHRCTPEFDEHSVPAGLLADHTTATGVWGRIVVARGELEYCVQGLADVMLLDADNPGVVIPEQPHRIRPVGPVSFHVEFWRAGVAESPR